MFLCSILCPQQYVHFNYIEIFTQSSDWSLMTWNSLLITLNQGYVSTALLTQFSLAQNKPEHFVLLQEWDLEAYC